MVLASAIFGLAAALWGVVISRRLSVIVGAALFVAVGYVLTGDLWRFSAGPITLTLGRLVLAGLSTVFLFRLGRGVARLQRVTAVDVFLLAFTGYLTARWALTPEAAADGTSVGPLWRLIASFLMPATLYGIVRTERITFGHWRGALAVLTGLGCYLGITAVAEISQQWWAVFPRFIADPTLGTHFGRARGPSLNSASLGVCLTVCIWAAWALLFWTHRRWRAPLTAAGFLMVAGVFFSYTRSTWLGLALTGALVPAITLGRKWKPFILASVAVGGLLGVLVLKGSVLDVGRTDSDGDPRHSVYQRASFAYVSLRMFEDAPLFGCGFGRFYDKKIAYLADRSQQLELESIRLLDHHNTFLSILTETGLVGLILFLGLLAAIAKVSIEAIRDTHSASWVRSQGAFSLAALLAYIASAAFHDLTLSPSEQWLLMLAAGMTVSLRRQAYATTVAPDPEAVRGNESFAESSNPTSSNQSATISEAKVSMFGIKIDSVDLASAVERVTRWCSEPRAAACRYVVTPNVDHVVQLKTNHELGAAYRAAAMVLADGAPIVAASRLLGNPLPERVAGSDLAPALFAEAGRSGNLQERPLTVFLLGAAPGVADEAAKRIHKRFQGVQVVGTCSPPLGFEHDPTQTDKICEMVSSAKPDVLLVGLGAPKQEIWTAQNHARLEAKVALCIGATIDFLAGHRSRAPLWMQHAGLEWLYRILKEPRRLAGRYFKDARVFPRLLLAEWLNRDVTASRVAPTG
ncbi:MAG: WecB/TagA/CpsF family glycosyltransferase [Planctomycetota bacterium]